jgi:hypothetical protein
MKYLTVVIMLMVATGCVYAEELPHCLTCRNTYDRCTSPCFGKDDSKNCIINCGAALVYCTTHCADTKPLPNASAPESLIGEYEGLSRACEGRDFKLTEKLVTIENCPEQPYQILEVDEQHIIISTLPSDKCSPKVIRFEIEKPIPAVGFTYGGFVLRWGKNQTEVESSCNLKPY